MTEQHTFAKEHSDNQSAWQNSGAKPNSPLSPVLQRFGNYDLVQRIGMGGMGEVYLARQRTAFGREVAVKIIRSDLMHDITIRKRFLREAEVNAYLKHDHILPLVEFGEENGRLFLVTPYIRGGTLSKRLRGGALSLAETHQLFTALVEAVTYLHKRGVIHRDLKPSNILLDHEEDSQRVYVRLIDFGIASLQGQAASAPLTTAGHEMGTEVYMAPERLSGIAAPSNDIYSLGLILFQMLTGKLPEDDIDSMLPEPLIEVVQQSTMPDPRQRYASAEELLKAFQRAYQSLSLSHFRVTGSSPQHPLVKPNIPTHIPPATPQQPTPPLTPVVPISDERPPRTPVNPLTNGQPRAVPIAPNMPPIEPKSYPLQPSQPVHLRSEIILPPLSDRTSPFKGEDYGAPTSYLVPQQLQKSSATIDHPGHVGQPPKKPLPSQKQKKRSMPLITIITAIILVIVFVIGALGYSIYQSFDTATVTVMPLIQPVNTTFTLTAEQGLTNVNANAGTIPAQTLSSTQSAPSQPTPTTGKSGGAGCILFNANCQQAVSQDDIDNLVSQLRPMVEAQIDKDMSQQAQVQGVMRLGAIKYGNETDIANPPVNTVSKTVTVTVSMEGVQQTIKSSDAQTVARQKLQQQLKPNYTLLDNTFKMSQPGTPSMDRQGNTHLNMAAAAAATYTITDTDKSNIQNKIVGKSPNDARAFIASNPNLDPNHIIIKVNYGGNLPGNAQQITISTVDPPIPPVQVPAVT